MTTSPAGSRAKLELLVRKDEAGAFELRKVSSAAAWIQLRPHRVEPDMFELAEVSSRLDGNHSFILKNKRTERFLLLSERERFLWDRMDGHTSLQDMATAFVLRYGEFDFDLIPTLIRKLQRAQLLTLAAGSRLRRALARNRRRRILRMAELALTALERINISSSTVHPLFARLYRWGGFLVFTPAAAIATLLLAIAGIMAAVQLWHGSEGGVAHNLGAHPVIALVSVKVLFLATLAGHQIVHGLALIHYGRRVREFGFTFLHGFVPTFYVDVTDIFMSSRRARIVTAVSGAAVHLVLGALWLMTAAWASTGFGRAFAAASGIIQWQAFVVALYPFCFIEMDGYHVLVDLLGLPTLKHDALAYVGGVLRGVSGIPRTAEQRLWIGYVVLSTLSIALFVAFNVWMIVRAAS